MVFAAVVFALIGLAASVVAFLGGQAIIGDGGASCPTRASSARSSARRSYLTGAGVLGLALGALLRSTPAAISTLFGAMFLLEGVAQLLLPAAWRDTVGPVPAVDRGRRVHRGDPAARHASARGPAWRSSSPTSLAVGAAAAWRLKRQDA